MHSAADWDNAGSSPAVSSKGGEKDRHRKNRQIKELRRQGIIPASSAKIDRRRIRKKNTSVQKRLEKQNKPKTAPSILPTRKAGYCDMCERVAFLTKHHLIPKQVRKMSLYNMHDQVTVKLCIPCHRKVHQLFPNWKLKDTYNTVEKLKSHPLIKEHIEYTRKENPNILPVANGKSNRL